MQSDIKTVLYDRPTVATSDYFKGKYIKVDGSSKIIDEETANSIEFYLIQNGYVDMKRKVTDKYRQDIKNGMVAELPDELKPMADGIHSLIQAVYDDNVLTDMFTDGHETKVKDNPLNDNFAKKEFQALWKEINHKYAYTVDFDSNELIRNSIDYINKELIVSELRYTTTIGSQKSEISSYDLDNGDSFANVKTRTQTLKHAEISDIRYDLIGKIAEGTTLTRKTVYKILQGIRIDKLYMFRNNPEDWAIAFYEGTVKHIFFIAETKGSTKNIELKPIEKAKIDCAEVLFNKMSSSQVRYHKVKSYQDLLNIMNNV